MSSPGYCLNCDAPLQSTNKFCAQCGQAANTNRLTLHHLLHEVTHFFTHADKGIFHLVKGLATTPGFIARSYIAGKRKKIFSPINFFLISVGLFLFVVTTFKPMTGGVDMTAVKTEVQKIPDAVVRERRLVKLERIEYGTNFMARNSNIINFVVTPLIALFFYVCFIKAGLNYTEHLVANFFFAGFSALVFAFIITPYLLLTKNTVWYFVGIVAFLLFEVFYRSISYYQLINKKGPKRYFYCLFLASCSMGLWYLVSTTLMRVYIDTGFKF
jgi:hypothetical protein